MSRLSLIALLTCLSAFQVNSQVPLRNKRIVKAIAAKDAELVQARKELKEGNVILQARYASLQSGFERAKAGQDPELLGELSLVLEDPLNAAKAALGGDPSNARNLRSMRREFEKGISRGLAGLKHPILRMIRQHISTPSMTVLNEWARKLAGKTAAELSFETLRRALDGVNFWDIWNSDFRHTLEEVKNYTTLSAKVAKLELDLAILRDPKMKYTIDAPEGMARVPGGSYIVEGLFGFPRKKKVIRVRTFFIDLREVSHGEYWSLYYVNLTDKKEKERRIPSDADRNFIWIQDPDTGEFMPPAKLLDRPVSGIDASSAGAFALSQGKRLPTEEEWVAAAAGSARGEARYPWGDVYSEGRCNDKGAGNSGTEDVSSNPSGRSTFGVFNMAGNVKEWCATRTDGKELPEKIPAVNVVVRGGSYLSDKSGVSTRWRWSLPAHFTYEPDVGFRCAQGVN